MKRVRPVLVTSLLAAALLAPTAPAQARSNANGVSPVDEMLKHGDLVSAVVTYPWVLTQYGETHAGLTTDHYDTRGRLVLKTEVDTAADGSVESRREASWVYDAKGSLVREADVSDFDGDGPEPPTTQATDTTFDKLGYASQMVLTTDYDSDGVPEQSSTYTFGNDHKGRAVTTTVDQDHDGDGAVDTVVRGVTTYDAKGNVLRDAGTYSTLQAEVLGSGETVNTYDQHGQVTSTSQTYYAADGSIVSRDATDTTFDVHGNALTIESTFVDGLSGTDYRNVASNVYDGHDRLLNSTSRSYFGDGSPAGVYETRYTYDGPGDYVTMEVLADYDGDGVPEPQGRLDVTYDRQGRPVLEVGTSAEGTTGRHEWTYDNQGRRTSFVSTWYDTEGTLLDRSTTRYAYPSRTDYTITTEIDYDGDGVPEVTSVESRQVG